MLRNKSSRTIHRLLRCFNGWGSSKPAAEREYELDIMELESRVLYDAAPIDIAAFTAYDAPQADGDFSVLMDLAEKLAAADAHPTSDDFSDWWKNHELSESQETLLSKLTASDLDLSQIQQTLDSFHPESTFDSLEQLIAEFNSDQSSLLDQSPHPSPISETNELLLVDRSVLNYQQLVDDFLNRQDTDRIVSVIYIDDSENGVSQISNALSAFHDLSAVHIVSHGQNGELRLGNLTLGQENLADYSEQIHQWQSSLSENADLLFYGCDLAGSENGLSLIGSIAALTGADVAASDDLTGHASLGGDWDLEYVYGEVESEIAFSSDVQQEWVHVLVPPTITMPGNPVDYVFNDPATIIDPAATLDDPDSTDFDTGTLTVTITNGTANDRLAIDTSGPLNIRTGNILEWKPSGPATQFGTISGGGSSPLVITFDANANDMYVEELLQSITYENVSTSPSTVQRVVEFVMTDGDGGTSNTETEFINLLDPKPTLDLDADDSEGTTGINFTTTYLFGAGNVRVADSDAVIIDADSTQINQLEAKLTTGYINGQDKLVHDQTLASSYGIGFTWNAAQGRLRLTGTATIAQYEEVLRTIEFTDLSGNPDPTNNRIVEFIVTDAESNSTTTIARSEIYIQKTSELWFTTGDVTGGQGVPELPNWGGEDILRLQNPVFEPGTSGGTISVAFDTNAVGGYSGNINAIHFVSRDIMVNGVQLEYGDILLSGKNPGFVGSIYATKGDLFY